MRVKSLSVYKRGSKPLALPPWPISPWQVAQLAINCTAPTLASPPLELEELLDEELEELLEPEELEEITVPLELLELDDELLLELEDEELELLEELLDDEVAPVLNQAFIKSAVKAAHSPVHFGASFAATGGIDAAMKLLEIWPASVIGYAPWLAPRPWQPAQPIRSKYSAPLFPA